MIKKLRRPESQIRILTTPDQICGGCPNYLGRGEGLTAQKTGRDDQVSAIQNRKHASRQERRGVSACCSLDKNEVENKDQKLIAALELDVERSWSWQELMQLVKERVTEEIFEAACGTCRWKKAGLCSYERYHESVSMVINAKNQSPFLEDITAPDNLTNE